MTVLRAKYDEEIVESLMSIRHLITTPTAAALYPKDAVDLRTRHRISTSVRMDWTDYTRFGKAVSSRGC